jgi:hypothetical protein
VKIRERSSVQFGGCAALPMSHCRCGVGRQDGFEKVGFGLDWRMNSAVLLREGERERMENAINGVNRARWGNSFFVHFVVHWKISYFNTRTNVYSNPPKQSEHLPARLPPKQ